MLGVHNALGSQRANKLVSTSDQVAFAGELTHSLAYGQLMGNMLAAH